MHNFVTMLDFNFSFVFDVREDKLRQFKLNRFWKVENDIYGKNSFL